MSSTILVVSHDRPWVDQYADALLEESFQVRIAFSASMAKEAIARVPTDLVLLDGLMPSPGVDLPRWFRQAVKPAPAVLILGGLDCDAIDDNVCCTPAVRPELIAPVVNRLVARGDRCTDRRIVIAHPWSLSPLDSSVASM